MSQRRERGGLRRRAVSLLLAVVMLVTLAQSAIVSAASYVEPYLNQVVEWGVMRGDIDGNLNPDNPISRAEFVTMINRAYGFTQMGTMPFTDVPEKAWYAEDVNIAYHTGYIQGTSSTTFSPSDSITREQATVILARILMMQAQVGENVDFNDSRDMNDWSRGLIATAADYGLIDGYSDGSFRPQNPITRGEASILLVRAVGTPILEPGEYRIGNTWGNVTISSSGVTLRDTVIGGNLYVSAGVDLGDVVLENVKVLGEIIVSGGGVSEDGDDSVILRNVTAPKLILDNFTGQTVSVRVEGDGLIQQADVRTNAFLADNAKDGYGVSKVRLDGEDGLKLTVAGNIKEVTNVTPGSTLSLARGQAAVINVDEKAENSTLRIEAGALAHEVNLDTATTITGSGDISSLVVNTSGSTVSMLPDEIVIRPGETANIGGELMDSNAAAEASADPRLSAGYPRIADLAPTSATAQFAANKKGIVYWAITAVTDGSVAAEDLINPSSYSPKIVKSGSLSLNGSGQVNAANITGLTTNGSYYLSAVFVDGREQRSPLKVISFTTPDNTKPDFASGYPYMSKITSISGQVTTMATKTCRLYWAVLPKGASAPTGEDFKANAVTGNLGFGVLDVTKNVANTFDVNSVPLEELASYDLYLWLTDVDGGQSSAVKKLSFTTVDGTPPVFNTEPTINKVDKTSVGLYANLNEDGTLYWVVVNEGETYPKPLAGQSGEVDLASDEAKLQVSAGMNALKSGTVTMTKDKDVSFTVSGLEEQKAYDLYYVAKDKAGNFSASVGKITIHTLDNTKPTVTQEFTKYNGTDVNVPLPETDVRLVFSEAVQTADSHETLVSLYQNVTANLGTAGEADARNAMGPALSKAIYLYQVPANTQPVKIEGATDADKTGDNWTIDYRYAEITLEEGKTVVTFPNGTGINLKSGATYYFEIQADTIADTSSAFNVMGRQQLDRFTTVFAIVNISSVNTSQITLPGDPGQTVDVNAVWQLDPVSADRVEDSVDWDMLIWSDTNLSFNLYGRREGGGWEMLNKDRDEITITLSSATEGYVGVSLTKDFLKYGDTMVDFNQLNQLDEGYTEFAMEFTAVNGLTDKMAWNGRVNIRVNAVAGSSGDLRLLAASVNEQNWQENVVNGDVTNIGQPENFVIKVAFSDQSIPEFTSGYPKFNEGASEVTMELLLNRPGTIYYVIAPRGTILTTDTSGKNYEDPLNYQTLREEGDLSIPMPVFNQPQVMSILNPNENYSQNPSIKYGNVGCQSSVVQMTVDGLTPETDYIVYFVIQNTAQNYSQSVQCYRFTTTDVGTPYITLNNQSPDVQFKTSENSELYYVLVAYNQIPEFLNEKFASLSYMDQEQLDTFQTTQLNQEMTILEALTTTVPEGSENEGPSVFDIYANDIIRDRVGKLIRRNQSSDPLTTATAGTMNLNKNDPQIQQFEEYMNMNTMYYCLAVARNKDGTIDGFKAIGGVNIPDNMPPILTVSGQGRATSTGWTGTLTLSFSEDLYWLSEDRQTLKEVWTVDGLSDDEKKSAIYILDPAVGLSGSASTKLKLTGGAIKSPSGVFTFEYKDVQEEDTLIFFKTGYASDASMNGRGMDTKVKTILTYTSEKGGVDGNFTIGRFVITQGAIDGDDPVFTP